MLNHVEDLRGGFITFSGCFNGGWFRRCHVGSSQEGGELWLESKKLLKFRRDRLVKTTEAFRERDREICLSPEQVD